MISKCEISRPLSCNRHKQTCCNAEAGGVFPHVEDQEEIAQEQRGQVADETLSVQVAKLLDIEVHADR